MKIRHPIAAVTAVLALVAAALSFVNAPASAAVGDITTLAGGPGVGPATEVGMRPGAVAVLGTTVYVADTANSVVRAIDTTTGDHWVVAGNGAAGFGGDEGLATAAQLNAPGGVAIDPSGQIVIADTGNNRIRRVRIGGVIETLAGNGAAAYGGDGAPATTALLSSPTGIALDGQANVYIADTGNHRVRKINNGGTGDMSTVAGIGAAGNGGGFNADGIPGRVAQLNYPKGLAVRGTNLYIADSGNNRVRRISTAVPNLIDTVAGTGSPGFGGDGGPAKAARLDSPYGVSLDGDGNLFIADRANSRIRRVDSSGVILTTTGDGNRGYGGDGGLATDASLDQPQAVAVAPEAGADLYIADFGNFRVRRVASTDGTMSTVGGNGWPSYSGDGGSATAAQFGYPREMAIDRDGNVFVADRVNNRIRRIDAHGHVTTVAGDGTRGYGGDGGPATDAQLNSPEGVAVEVNGALLIADTDNNRVRRVDVAGLITTVAGSAGCCFSGDGGAANEAKLFQPRSVAVGPLGTIYIADTSNHRIRMVDSAGNITTVAGSASGSTLGTGGFSGDGGPATAATLSNPGGVTVDRDGVVYIADTGNSVVREIRANGTIDTVAGSGVPIFSGDGGSPTQASLRGPESVAIDPSGALLIADTGNNRIRKVAAGVITTVAGTGTAGFAGDGTPATAAQLSSPSGVAVDTRGRVLIGDSSNRRVRAVQGPGEILGSPTITATNGTPQSAVIGSAFAVRFEAVARDSHDEPLAGVDVTFSAPTSGPGGTFDDRGASAVVTTNSSGKAIAPPFTANDRGGTYTVSAAVPGISPDAKFSLTNTSGPPATMSSTAGTPQSAHTGTQFPTRLQARVTDRAGNPLSDIAVVFSAPSDEPTGSFVTAEGGSARQITAPTDSAGLATAPDFTAGNGAGDYSVVASMDGSDLQAVFDLTNTASGEAIVTATAGTPQTAKLGTAFAEPLTVAVRDGDNQPVSDAVVTFVAPGSGPSVTFAGGGSAVTVSTGADGSATSPELKANAVAGRYEVAAKVGGISDPARFTLENVPGDASSLEATAGTPQSAEVGTRFRDLQARARDSLGNPVAGAEVTFRSPSRGPGARFAGEQVSATAVTDGRGLVTAPALAANDEAGTFTLMATVEATGVSTPYSLTNRQPIDDDGDSEVPAPTAASPPGAHQAPNQAPNQAPIRNPIPPAPSATSPLSPSVTAAPSGRSPAGPVSSATTDVSSDRTEMARSERGSAYPETAAAPGGGATGPRSVASPSSGSGEPTAVIGPVSGSSPASQTAESGAGPEPVRAFAFSRAGAGQSRWLLELSLLLAALSVGVLVAPAARRQR